jgi:glycerol-3-phosphate acyltransferase PlsY
VLLFGKTAFVLIAAYLLGSIPTALVISTRIKHVDIRRIGDGNMGARNTFHQLGPKFGVRVAIIDFFKGALPVFLAYILGLNLGWQMIAGILAILGHDFPVFANFKGGQGTATSLGTMLVLFPIPTVFGLVAYGLIFLIIKNSNISLGIGGAIVALILGISHQWLLFGYAVPVFVFIPIKLLIDSPRRRAIEEAKRRKNDV